jgi:hypothetical protein
LASWGGRPLLCVFDRPKTIALKWRKNGEVTEWNSVFAYATLEMGVRGEVSEPTTPVETNKCTPRLFFDRLYGSQKLCIPAHLDDH